MNWSYLGYGVLLGLLLALLQFFQYRLLVLDHAVEAYMGLIALLFTGLGIWAGGKLSRRGRPDAAGPVEELLRTGPEPDPRLMEKLGLTAREWEVLQLIAQGLSNQEIAARMFVSVNTVKTHTANVFAKLDARRRTQAVQKAKALGLLH